MDILGIEKIPEKAARKKILKILQKFGEEKIYTTNSFAVVPNPIGVHPLFDIYPLAEKQTKPLKKISAILTDMDGTTTTTETLCLYSLEFMVQQISKKHVSKLNPEKDYPHIIGNSTTKHIEYLLITYKDRIDSSSFIEAYLFSALWTLRNSKDEGRKDEVIHTAKALGFDANLLLKSHKDLSSKPYSPKYHKSLLQKINQSFPLMPFSLHVKMATDIYYQRYHEILMGISEGKATQLAKSLVGGKKLIEPMPGVALFLALIKGLLGNEADKVVSFEDRSQKKILLLGRVFEQNPIKLALVTSSIRYEAEIVLNEVFKVLREQILGWPVSEKRKRGILEQFNDYRNFYDAIITATDSNEIRLKPHRDLYSIALYKLGIPESEFQNVLGFEDSESGLVSLRAAGVGRAIGVPFDATKNHNLKAASLVLTRGLSELIFDKDMFLKL